MSWSSSANYLHTGNWVLLSYDITNSSEIGNEETTSTGGSSTMASFSNQLTLYSSGGYTRAVSGDTISEAANFSLGGTLGVTGAATLSSTLSAGASTLASATISGNASVGGTLGVTGNATLGGTLDVTNAATLNSSLDVSGAVGIDGDFDINTDKFTVASSTGNTAIAGTLAVTSTISAATGSTIGTLTLADGSITDSGGAISFNDENLSTSGTLASGNLSVTGTGSFSGTVSAATGSTIGTLTLADGSITDSGGAISFNDENLSTSGTLASGNLSVTGTATVSGATSLGNTLSVTGAATLSSSLDVSGAVGIDGDFDINTDKFTVASSTGNTAIAGTLTVTDAATLSSSLGVSGAATLSDTLAVSGEATFSSHVTVAGNLTVSGTTTTVDTETLLVEDNVIVLNTSPASALDGGVLVRRHYDDWGTALQSGVTPASWTASTKELEFDIGVSSVGADAYAGYIIVDADGRVNTIASHAAISTSGDHVFVLSGDWDLAFDNVSSDIYSSDISSPSVAVSVYAPNVGQYVGMLFDTAHAGGISAFDDTFILGSFGAAPGAGASAAAATMGSPMELGAKGFAALTGGVSGYSSSTSTTHAAFQLNSSGSGHKINLDSGAGSPDFTINLGTASSGFSDELMKVYSSSGTSYLNVKTDEANVQLDTSGHFSISDESSISHNLLKVEQSGDVTIDDYASGNGIKWGSSAKQLIIKESTQEKLKFSGSSAFLQTGALAVYSDHASSGLSGDADGYVTHGVSKFTELSTAPTAVSGFGMLYVKDDGDTTSNSAELFYKDAAGNEVKITENGALSISGVSFSLDEAYNDGRSIDADSGTVMITRAASGSSDRDSALHLYSDGVNSSQELTNSEPMLQLDVSSGDYTAALNGIKVDFSGADSITDTTADAKGIELRGISNSGSGKVSAGLVVDSEWDVQAEFGDSFSDSDVRITAGSSNAGALNFYSGSSAAAYVKYDGAASEFMIGASNHDLVIESGTGDIYLENSGEISVVPNLDAESSASWSAGDILCFGANGKLQQADKSSADPSGGGVNSDKSCPIGVAMATSSLSDNPMATVHGSVVQVSTSLTSMDNGTALYLDASGAVSSTPSSTGGDEVWRVGFVFDAANSKMIWMPQFIMSNPA